MTSATACGKLILCGEHAVVYQQQAVAIPLTELRALVSIQKSPGKSLIQAPDIAISLPFNTGNHPLQITLQQAQSFFQIDLSDHSIILHSEIPIGSGLGSGAAITAAIFRACAKFAQQATQIHDELRFIHEIEKLYHGQPSGIDGEVIAREKALLFSKMDPYKEFNLPAGLSLAICNSGPAKPTHEVVSQVRIRAEQSPQEYQLIFTEIGQISSMAYQALLDSNLQELGKLLNQNHSLLQKLGVSSPRLDILVQKAQVAGALGAKLSGAGQGGICFALCHDTSLPAIIRAWKKENVSWIKTCRF